MLLVKLFVTFFKIGLFSFGGGYGMLSVIQGEVVTRYSWLTMSEFTDIVAISQITPGPIAINSATYVGYKICGFFGSLAATVSVVLAPFTIIYLIIPLISQTCIPSFSTL